MGYLRVSISVAAISAHSAMALIGGYWEKGLSIIFFND